MCAVSVILGYMEERVPPKRWERPSFELLEEILRLTEELDRVLGEPDCIDPKKAEYLERVRTVLRSR